MAKRCEVIEGSGTWPYIARCSEDGCCRLLKTSHSALRSFEGQILCTNHRDLLVGSFGDLVEIIELEGMEEDKEKGDEVPLDRPRE